MFADDGDEREPSITEIMEEAFPYYLSIGMTSDEYWNASPYLVYAYRKADEYKQDRMSQEAWLQGLYIYGAFGAVLSNAFSKKGAQKAEYFKEAFRFRKKSKAEIAAEAEKERRKITAYFDGMMAQQKARKARENNGSNNS